MPSIDADQVQLFNHAQPGRWQLWAIHHQLQAVLKNTIGLSSISIVLTFDNSK
jgi:hypothetical protein